MHMVSHPAKLVLSATVTALRLRFLKFKMERKIPGRRKLIKFINENKN
jgi:hypothetical protein